jgi:hypothetical protein
MILQNIERKISLLNQKVGNTMYSDEEYSSDLSECEEKCDDRLLSQEDPGPKFSKEEIRMLNTYTYDDEPVKTWRQYSDYTVIKECNEYTWYEIQQVLGKFSGFNESTDLFKSKSDLINLLEIFLCKNRCYFFPGKCLFKHGYDLKYLMKKTLHDEYGPKFADLFSRNVDGIKIEVFPNGRPKLWELAAKIAFSNTLEYDEYGFLKIDFSVLQEKFWKHNRPCYVKEANKVLNVIHALLLLSSEKREEEIFEATKTYSQSLPEIHDPVFKSMCFGPDFTYKPAGQEDIVCDLQGDEHKTRFNVNVKHKKCSDLDEGKHWTYHHGNKTSDISECKLGKEPILEGPVCDKNSQIIYYPCNLKHCWICCDCRFCKLAKLVNCKDHTDHIKFSIKDCFIQENAQCQEHWIDHIDNFDDIEDIKVDVKLIFHKKKLIVNGRNYTLKTLRYAGLKMACKKCRKNTSEHLSKHLSPHLQCKHCMFEMKMLTEMEFWERVCNICGKIFENRLLRRLHSNRYNVSEQVCEICSMKFSSKFNLSRHLTEQHDAMKDIGFHKDDGNQETSYKCKTCDRAFWYQRNLKLHEYSVHDKKDQVQCKLCDEEFSSKGNLKRHLEEQHKVFDLDNPIQSRNPSKIMCALCDLTFKRNEHLASHMNTHKPKQDKFTCTDCGKQFTARSSLNRHSTIHSENREKFSCNVCQKTFSRKGHLARHIEGVHKKQDNK